MGIVNIGNRRQTDFKSPIGLFKLARKSILLGGGVGQIVQCRQYAKVALRHPQNQLILGVMEVDIRLAHHRIRQPLLHLVAPVIDRLRQLDRVIMGVIGRIFQCRTDDARDVATGERGVHIRQQQSAGLRLGFL